RGIHQSDRELGRKDLGLALDRSLRERGSPLVERDRVERSDARQPRLERKLKTAWENGRLRHALSVAASIRAKASLSLGVGYGASRVTCAGGAQIGRAHV